MEISPKYQMKLVEQIEQKIWSEYSSYKQVEAYIIKWHESGGDWNNYSENFTIIRKDSG